MPNDRDLWALALKVERDHGVDGPRHIAEQVEAAAIAGKQGRIDLQKAVAQRYGQLQRAERQLVE